MKTLMLLCIGSCIFLCGCETTPSVNSDVGVQSNRVNAKVADRLVEGWGRVQFELLGSHSCVPEAAQTVSKPRLDEYVRQIDTLVANKQWGEVWSAWSKDENAKYMVYLGINWRYKGNGGAGYREYDRWHVREFEKAAALLSGDKKAQKTVAWLYGDLKRAPKPALPNY